MQSTIVRVGPPAAAVPEKLLEQYGFSSDRTIAGYARGIWNIVPCPVT